MSSKSPNSKCFSQFKIYACFDVTLLEKRGEKTKDNRKNYLHLAYLATWFGALFIVEQP